MLEKLLQLDVQLLIFLNSFGSTTFDGLWLFITKQSNWTPFFLVLLYLVYKKIGIKSTLYLFLFVTLLLVVTDQTSNLFKATFQR